MGHMARSLCAGMLAEGKIKKHNSNGTIVAVHDEFVYLTCANGKDRILGLSDKVEVVNKYTTNAGLGDTERPVTCFRKNCVHWVRLSKIT